MPQQKRPSFFAPKPQAQQAYALVPPQPYPLPYVPAARPAVPEQMTVNITVLSDSHATVARAALSADEYSPVVTAVTGSSRKKNEDDYDPEIGTLYAVRRALLKLAGEMGKAADARVRQADSVRAHRAQSRRGKREKAQEEEEQGRSNLAQFLTAAYAAGIPRELLDKIWAEHKNHEHDSVSVHVVGFGEIPPEVLQLLREQFPDAVISDDGSVSLDAGTFSPADLISTKVYGKGRHAKDEPEEKEAE